MWESRAYPDESTAERAPRLTAMDTPGIRSKSQEGDRGRQRSEQILEAFVAHLRLQLDHTRTWPPDIESAGESGVSLLQLKHRGAQ